MRDFERRDRRSQVTAFLNAGVYDKLNNDTESRYGT